MSSISAVAHACPMLRESAALEYWKMTIGMAFIVVPKSRKFAAFVPRAVRINGAVSPSPRLNARTKPVRIPENAVLHVTKSVVFHTGMPSASDASLTPCGTSLSTSWVVRMSTGIMRIESATIAAHPENPRIGTKTR